MRPGPSWGKKDKRCDVDDPADAQQGSFWDHVILDVETRLIVSLAVGRRNADTVVQVFTDFYGRTGGHLPQLIVTDEYTPYKTVILDVYGVLREDLTLTPEEEREYDREGMGRYFFPVEITYATVHKEREKGRVVGVTEQVVLGSEEQAGQTVAESEQSRTINTSFVERWFGTQRQFNARKKREAYTFSKDWYNFGWCVRTLRQKVQQEPARYQQRTPAMAAGLADHAWSMEELLSRPLYPLEDSRQRPVRTYDDVLARLHRGKAELASG
jgi:hypothetical protein